MGKLLIFAAPSGAGKTTIVRHLLGRFPQLAFSVSATTRNQRPHEQDGRDYYFMDTDTFRQKMAQGEFVEWEEVYEGQYYGTLRAEIERLWSEGRHVLFDVDVKGALRLKAAYPDQALAVFVKPPGPETIRQRLIARGTETPETLAKRMARVAEELSYELRFDQVLINDDLSRALAEAETLVANQLAKP